MRVTKKSRRQTVVGAVAAAITVALAGCATGASGSGDPVELSDEDVTITIAWWGADSRTAITKEALDAFQEKYPNITVTSEFSDWTGYWDRLATASAGKNAPDVIQMDELYLASYADRGALFDLELAPQLDSAALPEDILDLGRIGDTLYAYPVSTVPFTVLVNETLLDSLGLELPDTDTWTWEELTEFAQSVTAASGGEVVGISPLNNGFGLQLWARQNGDELFTDGAVSVSEETLTGFFQTALDWTQNGASASASRLTESNAAAIEQTDFGTSRQALLFAQATQISAYSVAAGGAEMSLVLPPSNDENTTPYAYMKAGMYWTVSSGSDHPAEAALLIDFLTNSVEAGEILNTDRGIPSNPEVRSVLEESAEGYPAKIFSYITEVEPTIGEAPTVTPNGASELDKLIARYLQEVVFEEQTPEAAAAAFIAELQASIDAAS